MSNKNPIKSQIILYYFIRFVITNLVYVITNIYIHMFEYYIYAPIPIISRSYPDPDPDNGPDPDS